MPLTLAPNSPTATGTQWVHVATLTELEAAGRLTVRAQQHVVALFAHHGQVYAVDNRCPHMGFPLDKGTVNDCILTCHWHHARFDLASGGTFDLWADDVRRFPVKIEHNDIWVDVTPPGNVRERQQRRLTDGLERNIRLVIAKSVLGLVRDGNPDDARTPFAIGLDYGARHRQDGWSTGQTINTVMMNLLPSLDADDRPRALYTGLTAIGRDCAGQPARFAVAPPAPLRHRPANPQTLVPPVHRSARHRRRRTLPGLGNPRRASAGRHCGHALCGRNRPPLPGHRARPGLYQQSL
jgi:nitrite reductase/ring-hydroxylating ferredoxin subunit